MLIMRLRYRNAIAYLHSPSGCDVIHCHTNTGLVLINDTKTATENTTTDYLLDQFRTSSLPKHTEFNQLLHNISRRVCRLLLFYALCTYYFSCKITEFIKMINLGSYLRKENSNCIISTNQHTDTNGMQRESKLLLDTNPLSFMMSCCLTI